MGLRGLSTARQGQELGLLSFVAARCDDELLETHLHHHPPTPHSEALHSSAVPLGVLLLQRRQQQHHPHCDAVALQRSLGASAAAPVAVRVRRAVDDVEKVSPCAAQPWVTRGAPKPLLLEGAQQHLAEWDGVAPLAAASAPRYRLQRDSSAPMRLPLV